MGSMLSSMQVTNAHVLEVEGPGTLSLIAPLDLFERLDDPVIIAAMSYDAYSATRPLTRRYSHAGISALALG